MYPHEWVLMMFRVWCKEQNNLVGQMSRFQLLPWHNCEVTLVSWLETKQDTREVYMHFSGWLWWQFNWYSLGDDEAKP